MKKLLILILLFPLIGCWNYQEIKELIGVLGVAIDKGENERFLITVETIKLSPSKDEKAKPVLYAEEGRTVFECMQMLVAKTGRKLYIGHMMAIIIGEELAREGIIEVLDFFIRDHESRLSVDVFIARGLQGKDILNSKATHDEIVSFELDKQIDNTQHYSGIRKSKTLFKSYNDFFKRGIDPVLPAISLFEHDEKTKSFKLDGYGCFKENRLVGYLEPEHMPYFASFVDCYSGGIIPIEIGNNGYISCEILDSKTKTKVKLQNEEFHLYLKIEIGFTLGENSTNEDVKLTTFRPTDIERLFVDDRIQKSKELLEYVRTEIEADIFGIQNKVYRLSYKNWQKYHQTYDFLRSTVVHFDVKAQFISPGTIRIEEGEIHE